MSFQAMIQFAPCTSLERTNDPRRGDRQFYDSGALKLLPAEQSIPLLENHDPGRELGRVTKLLRLKDLDGEHWLCAIATLDKCPHWLKRGTAASFRFVPLQWSSFDDKVLRSGIVREVSVLNGVEPADPDARVLHVNPIESREPHPLSPAQLRALNERLERLGIRGTLKPITATPSPRRLTPEESMYAAREREHAERLQGQGILYRPAIGQVLRVR
jgi:hypothetical protein